ncbi:hypothetical protein [Alkaliflexus imshenetskii]|uniref:hypothetical protein n=1 Tax=Alkaliflexus imshenetskii TaxID=286730 RepID=UPI00047C0AD2|nr:hypothetical protein [Alkaliflexus imshenetskii]
MSETLNKGNRTKWQFVFGILVGIAISFLLSLSLCKHQTDRIDKALVEVAEELNRICPFMVDDETRLDNATVLPGKVFQYGYTLVNFERDSIDVDVFVSHMQPVILNNVKTNPELKTFREQNVTIIYQYNDKNGEHIAKITVSPDLYRSNSPN